MIPRNWWNVQEMSDEKRWANLTLFLKDVYNILLKGITLADNVRGAILTIEFDAADTDTQARHGLSFIPSNYILIGSSVSLNIYDADTANTKDFVYLKSDTIGIARVFIF